MSKKKLPIPEGLRGTTCALFYEWRHATTSKIKAPYTLKTLDHKDPKGNMVKSMYLLYMECSSEYEAALKLLGHYPHWLKLCDCDWFSKHITKWREEMALRDYAIAKAKLVELSKEGNCAAASRLLTEAKDKGKVGSPKRGGKRDKALVDSDLTDLLEHADTLDKEGKSSCH